MVGAEAVDKENVVPDARRARAGSGGGKVFDAKRFEQGAEDDGRTELAKRALAKGSAVGDQEALFEFDARRLVHLSPDLATKTQMAKLERDTAEMENTSYAKLRLWTALASFLEKKSTGACVRQVFERMLELGIAKYYKELYESWAAFEIRCGSLENARSAVARAVQNKVIPVKARDEALASWVAKYQAQVDADETMAFPTAPPASSSARTARAAAEPTVVLANQPPSTVLAGVPSTAKKQPAMSLRVPKASKLNKLGRAQRVVVSNVLADPEPQAAAEQGGDASEENTSPEATASQSPDSNQDSGNGNILDKIGDAAQNTLQPRRAFSQNCSSSSSDATLERDQQLSGGALAQTVTFHNPNTQHLAAAAGARGAGATSHTMGSVCSRSTVMHTRASEFQGGAIPSELRAFHESLLSPKNVFVVNGRPYLRLAVIGRGGSSKVFKVLAVGEVEPQTYALKRIKLQRTDAASVSTFVNEITLLERLRGNPNIISLVDAEVNLEARVIYMVMELGEIDLNTMLQQQRSTARQAGPAAATQRSASSMVGNLSVNFVRLTWMNMLEAVHAIHEERIVHGDLKPANFMFVKGKLKLIDFGIAKAISNDTTNIMRDTQVGTLNYMSPEAIIDTNSAAGARPRIGAPGMRLKQGRASDIWSMGCILYQMIYGQTPFHDLKLIQKIHCISDPNYEIAYPDLDEPNPALIDVVKRCLRFDPAQRLPIVPGAPGAPSLLTHAFLNPSPSNAAPPQQQGQTLANVNRLVQEVLKHSSELTAMRDRTPDRFAKIIARLAAQLDLCAGAHKAEGAPSTAESSPSSTLDVIGGSPHEQGGPSRRRDRGGETSPACIPSATSAAHLAAAGAALRRPTHALDQLATAQSKLRQVPKEKAPLPDGLQQSILSGKARLQPVEESSSSRFMRPKGGTPDREKGLVSLLREGLERKRDLLESQEHTMEAIVRSGTTWDFLGE